MPSWGLIDAARSHHQVRIENQLLAGAFDGDDEYVVVRALARGQEL
jgi:hypothetical protein